MLAKKTSAEAASSKTGILKKKKTESLYPSRDIYEEIRVQAYYNYLGRMSGNLPGDEMADWLDAEIRVRSKMSTH